MKILAPVLLLVASLLAQNRHEMIAESFDAKSLNTATFTYKQVDPEFTLDGEHSGWSVEDYDAGKNCRLHNPTSISLCRAVLVNVKATAPFTYAFPHPGTYTVTLYAVESTVVPNRVRYGSVAVTIAAPITVTHTTLDPLGGGR